MTIRRMTFRAIGIAGLTMAMCVFALAACGDDGESEARDMRLTFDGETCIYEGGEELTAGPVTLEFVNQSEADAVMNLARHTGDEPIEDVVAYIGEDPSKFAPSYAADLGGVWHPTASGETFLWEGELEPGIHHMICAELYPFAAWFGAGLTVTE